MSITLSVLQHVGNNTPLVQKCSSYRVMELIMLFNIFTRKYEFSCLGKSVKLWYIPKEVYYPKNIPASKAKFNLMR
jgi:hypothetical protein